jgi:hypothetical protein
MSCMSTRLVPDGVAGGLCLMPEGVVAASNLPSCESPTASAYVALEVLLERFVLFSFDVFLVQLMNEKASRVEAWQHECGYVDSDACGEAPMPTPDSSAYTRIECSCSQIS